IWDTAGQERYNSLSSAYCKGADACVLCYDITDTQSFVDIDKWRKLFIEHNDTDNNIRFLLVGTKWDLHKTNTANANFNSTGVKPSPPYSHGGNEDGDDDNDNDNDDGDGDGDDNGHLQDTSHLIDANNTTLSPFSPTTFIDTDRAQAYADMHHMIFYETSALTGKNVNDCFRDLAETVVDNCKVTYVTIFFFNFFKK
ncbi:GTP-binding protein, partial [Reticulomyxa filosa]